MRPLPVELPVAFPEDGKSRERVARRQATRLHAARLGDRYLPAAPEPDLTPRCSECGTEMDNCTLGCRRCGIRRRNRERIAA